MSTRGFKNSTSQTSKNEQKTGLSTLGVNLTKRLYTWPVEPRGQTPNSSLEVKQKFI